MGGDIRLEKIQERTFRIEIDSFRIETVHLGHLRLGCKGEVLDRVRRLH